MSTRSLSQAVPTRKFIADGGQFHLMSLYHQWKKEKQGQPLSSHVPTGARTVCGYTLPSFQRDYVWTDEQCEKFLESAYMGLHLGTYVYNDIQQFKSPELSYLLIDGQQRLTAISRYWNDEISIAGEDGVRRKWSELKDTEQAHFMRIGIGWACTNTQDENVLRDLYNRMAFGGTPHAQEQRASLKI